MKKSIQSPATGTFLGLVEFWLSTRVEICWSSILQYIKCTVKCTNFDTRGVPVIIMDLKMSSSLHVQVYRMFTP